VPRPRLLLRRLQHVGIQLDRQSCAHAGQANPIALARQACEWKRGARRSRRFNVR
jgi:hypothetical protein